jgi:hypothetical protein
VARQGDTGYADRTTAEIEREIAAMEAERAEVLAALAEHREDQDPSTLSKLVGLDDWERKARATVYSDVELQELNQLVVALDNNIAKAQAALDARALGERPHPKTQTYAEAKDRPLTRSTDGPSDTHCDKFGLLEDLAGLTPETCKKRRQWERDRQWRDAKRKWGPWVAGALVVAAGAAAAFWAS